MMNLHREEGMAILFHYDVAGLRQLLESVIRKHIAPDVWQWLQEQGAAAAAGKPVAAAFALMPRKTGRAAISITPEQQQHVQTFRPNLFIQHWTIDQLCRVWLLLQVDASDKHEYFKKIEALFLSAAVSEAVALYAALPLLAYPEQWRARCAEGIRSNIGDVLQTIMCLNPYPAEQLHEGEWNQLVLKAFFTDKPINQIIGLDERANQALADTLSDYAHERWAAARPVNPLLWRCVGRFINVQIFPDIKRLAASERKEDKIAAVLACRESMYSPANELIKNHPELQQLVDNPNLSWDSLAP